MQKGTITPVLVDRIVQLLITQLPVPREAIYSEIQDDFQALFVAISIDALMEEEVALTLKLAGEIMHSEMPSRIDDYSWIVGLKRAGEIVDGCFGGDLPAPG